MNHAPTAIMRLRHQHEDVPLKKKNVRAAENTKTGNLIKLSGQR